MRRRGCAASPKKAWAERAKTFFIENENEIVKKGLRDQHTIERIAMRSRQCARRLSVTNGNRQAYEALALDHSGQAADDCARCRQLPQPMPRRNLPHGGRADKDGIQLLADGFARVHAQPLVSRQPPKKCVSVEEGSCHFPPIQPTRRSSWARKNPAPHSAPP